MGIALSLLEEPSLNSIRADEWLPYGRSLPGNRSLAAQRSDDGPSIDTARIYVLR
jgi:hypothetical protein